MGEKTTVWTFQVTNKRIFTKTWKCLRKGNFKRKTEYLLIAVQNNAIRSNNVKIKINNTL